MGMVSAAVGSAVWFALAPFVVAGLIPWWLADWRLEPTGPAVGVIGALLVCAGTGVLIDAFSRFVRDGRGTPAPVAAPNRLVVAGWYRYVRNPMYLAVFAIIAGQALALGELRILVYLGTVVATCITFVRLYEEVELRRRFGSDYEMYRQSVPGWWPRTKPWTPRVGSE